MKEGERKKIKAKDMKEGMCSNKGRNIAKKTDKWRNKIPRKRIKREGEGGRTLMGEGKEGKKGRWEEIMELEI